jgi:hypothetical protein
VLILTVPEAYRHLGTHFLTLSNKYKVLLNKELRAKSLRQKQAFFSATGSGLVLSPTVLQPLITGGIAVGIRSPCSAKVEIESNFTFYLYLTQW